MSLRFGPTTPRFRRSSSRHDGSDALQGARSARDSGRARACSAKPFAPISPFWVARHSHVFAIAIALIGVLVAAALLMTGSFERSSPSPSEKSVGVSPPPAPSAVVLFERNGALVLANVDGPGERELLRSYLFVIGAEPSVSPDGTRIAVADPEGINVVDLAAPAARRIVASQDYASLARWSPDGSLIAYVDDFSIWVVRPDGSEARVVVPDSGDGGYAWSPDGSRIAAWGGLFDVKTSKHTTIAGVEDLDDPAWSPNGELIAFERKDGLWIVRPDGSGLWRLSGPPPDIDVGYRPAWSPDSKQVAYTAKSRVYVVDVGAGVARPLTTSLAGEATSQPSWSPDGKRIAYIRDRGQGYLAGSDVWVVNADGSHDRPVTGTAAGKAGAVSWVPGLSRVEAEGAEKGPANVQLHAERTVSIEGEIVALDAEGDTAAIVTTPPGEYEYEAVVWSRTGTTVRTLAPVCVEGFMDLALSRSDVSWTCLLIGNTFRDESVHTVPLTGGRPVQVADHAGVGEENSVAASDGLTVFTVDGELWTLHAGRARPLPASSPYESVADVAGDRIAAVGFNWSNIDVLSRTGRRIRRFPGFSDQALIAGNSLVVERDAKISVYDIPSGRLIRRFQARGAGVMDWDRSLETARGRLVAYVTASGLHVYDVATKREALIRVPQLAGNINASFGANGLFVSYTRTYSSKPGRVAFVPWRLLPPLHRAP